MLNFLMKAQPDGVTCGPTCLYAIYQFYGNKITLEEVIKNVPYLENGGTLAVLLGCHALSLGYQATLHSLNLHIIDPSWVKLPSHELLAKLHQLLKHTKNQKIAATTQAYIQFLKLGGKILFSEVNEQLVKNYFDKNIPLLSGVSATYLYQNMRDYTGENNQVIYDEFLGEPTGHFIVLTGYDSEKHTVYIADPYLPHPLAEDHNYIVPFSRWLHAHLLGSMTFDSELLAIEKSEIFQPLQKRESE